MPQTISSPTDFKQLALDIKRWSGELGFQQTGITDTQLAAAEQGLQQWLSLGYQGDMDYMAKHGVKRTRPDELIPGTLRVISVRLNYVAPQARDSWNVINDDDGAFISRYALGRDYHKVMRHKLAKLVSKIETQTNAGQFRVFTDSAPVMEVELAKKSGIGWRGKHTLLLTREAGSLFFLGEIYTDLPLPIDGEQKEHCGTCQACIDICPTKAIVAPYQLDARRCISYLTIEHHGSIPLEFRAAIGNRIYGCDDCQLVCPWNKYAQLTTEGDFAIRNDLDDVSLVELFGWSEADFNERLAGSAIRRIGHDRWLRNIAVALGNALANKNLAVDARNRLGAALQSRAEHASPMVREHAEWALAQGE
jgi:epoxyqueuosine reductase